MLLHEHGRWMPGHPPGPCNGRHCHQQISLSSVQQLFFSLRYLLLRPSPVPHLFFDITGCSSSSSHISLPPSLLHLLCPHLLPSFLTFHLCLFYFRIPLRQTMTTLAPHHVVVRSPPSISPSHVQNLIINSPFCRHFQPSLQSTT